MEPLGTITVHFPFIDAETRTVLEETMKQAIDYSDFVSQLTDMILGSTCSDILVYLTVHHTLLLFDLKRIDSIVEKYKNIDIIKPNLLLCYSVLGRSNSDNEIVEAADSILATNPDDWLALEMRLIKFEVEMMNYPKTMYDEVNLDIIVDTIKRNPQFGFYESILFDNFAYRVMADGQSKERIMYLEKGLNCAEAFDDRVRISDFLNKLSRAFLDEDRKKAKDMLLHAIEISKSLGLQTDLADSQEQLSKIEAIRGQFDSAISHMEETIAILESVGFPSGNLSLMLSTLYIFIGEYDSGYEWGLMAEDQFNDRPHLKPRAILNQAWALAHQGKTNEAEILLESIRKNVLHSGRETQIAWLHFVTGILEISEGELLSASSSIDEAMKIYENREGSTLFQLIFLYYLAEIEVSLSEDSNFPSLCLLEEKSRQDDLPGIYGLVLLLKAEIAIKERNDSVLREIVNQLRPLTESASMSYLKPRFSYLLSRI